MNYQQTIRETRIDESINYPSQTSRKGYYPDRRQLEMKRRFGVLQSRRTHLERELKAIKVGLSQLDNQMQSYSAYKQLSIQNQVNPAS